MKIDNWKIFRRPLLAKKITPIVVFVMIQRIFHLEPQRQRTLQFLFGGGRSSNFHSSIKSTFLASERLLCLYDKQNNTWLLVDIKFLLSCLTRHLTRSLRSLVRYRVKHSKRNSISTRAYALFSLSVYTYYVVDEEYAY